MRGTIDPHPLVGQGLQWTCEPCYVLMILVSTCKALDQEADIVRRCQSQRDAFGMRNPCLQQAKEVCSRQPNQHVDREQALSLPTGR